MGIVPGQERARALGELIVELRKAETLPIAGDLSVSLPGIHCHARRIGKTRLWLCYAADETTLELVAVQTWDV